MKKILAILFTVLTFTLISCESTEQIPEDLSPAQLIQKGQSAYELAQYKSAETYYNTVITRYGNNTENYIEAKYELGHLYIKTKEYKKAYDALSEILEIYSYASYGELPAAYKKLAQIEMAKIPESKLNEFEAEKAAKAAELEAKEAEEAEAEIEAEYEEADDEVVNASDEDEAFTMNEAEETMED